MKFKVYQVRLLTAVILLLTGVGAFTSIPVQADTVSQSISENSPIPAQEETGSENSADHIHADTVSENSAISDQTTGPLYLNEGDNLTMQVVCEDGVAYQWYYSEGHSRRWVKCSQPGSDSACLSLTYSTELDENAYRCRITEESRKEVCSEPVYLRNVPEDTINIQTYGAVGDGITDDTAALQTAFSAAEGKSLYIPAGTYLFSSTLQIPSGCHVYGTGSASVLKLADQYSLERVTWRNGSKACMLLLDENTSGCRLENFTLEGQTAQYADDGQYGLCVMGRNHSLINLQVHDINYFPENWLGGSKGYGSVNAPGYGVAVYQAYDVDIYGGCFYNCGYEDIGVEESQYVLVDHVECGIANRVPLQIHRNSAHIIVQDSYLHNNDNPVKTESGLTIHGTADTPIENVLIKDCTITGGHIYGVQGGENYITVQNCYVEKTIFTDGNYSSDHDWLITGCTIGGSVNLHGTNMTVENNS